MSASHPEGDNNIITTSEDDGDAQKEENGLRFSRARCIALVATLTGASFLNVILTPPRGIQPHTRPQTDRYQRRSHYRWSSSSCQP